jgi:hypothetical protein
MQEVLHIEQGGGMDFKEEILGPSVCCGCLASFSPQTEGSVEPILDAHLWKLKSQLAMPQNNLW